MVNITKLNEWASIDKSLSVVGKRTLMMFPLSSSTWNSLTNLNLSNFLGFLFHLYAQLLQFAY